MSTETKDILIPQHCPHCEENFQWAMSPGEALDWASCLTAAGERRFVMPVSSWNMPGKGPHHG